MRALEAEHRDGEPGASDTYWVSSETSPVDETSPSQQLPTPCSSQENSTPFGWTTPLGWKLRRLRVQRLRLEVPICAAGQQAPRTAPDT